MTPATQAQIILYMAVMLWMCLPVIPISMTWVTIRRRSDALETDSLAIAVAGVITVSYLLLALGMFWANVIGRDYTTRRYVTIWLNVIALIAVGFAGASRSKIQLWSVMSSILVITCWLYLGVIGSVV